MSDDEERMSNQEAITVLTAVAGVIGLCALTAEDSEFMGGLFSKFKEAVEIATDAINIMDHQMTIEDNNDDK